MSESFDAARQQLRSYVADQLPRKFEVWYDSNTQSIHVLDSMEQLEKVANSVQSNLIRLENGIRLLKLTKY